MRFHRAQPPRARDRGVIWRRLGQPQFSKLAQRQRIRRPPRDATLPLNPFEISDQQQAKIPPRRQRRTPHRLRAEALTLPLYKLSNPRSSSSWFNPGRTDVPPSAAIACGQSKTLPALAAAPLFVPSPCTHFTNLRSGLRKKLHERIQTFTTDCSRETLIKLSAFHNRSS